MPVTKKARVANPKQAAVKAHGQEVGDDLLRGILDAAGRTAIYSISPLGTILSWNRGAEHIFGWSADEIIGQDFRRFYPKEDLDAGVIEKEMREAERTGLYEAEGWRYRKDGSLFFGKVNFSCLRDEDGRPVGFVKIVNDDTERKRNEQFTRSLIDGAGKTAIYSIDPAGMVTTWNRGAEHIFGFSAAEILGKDFRRFYPKEELERGVIEHEMRESSLHGTYQAEGWRYRKDGTMFYGKVNFSALRDERNNVVGFVKIVIDDTDRKKNEQFMKSLIDGAGKTAIYSITLEGMVQTWNKGAEHVFGWAADEIIGKDFRRFYPKEDLDRGIIETEMRESSQRGTIEAEGWRIKKDGSLFYGRVNFSALRDERGNVIGFVKLVVDETEKKRMEDANKERQNEASEVISILNSTITQISAVAAQLSSSTAETTTAIAEATSVAEEVRQTAEQTSTEAKNVSADAKSVVVVSKQGEEVTAATIKGMLRIREQMQSIAECMSQLENQSKLIGDIIATVDDLAQQSNLLAVNASIEAAKAGEQGKGFAVVAQEVKNLSEQSKSATAHVRSILNDIVKATNNATSATDQGNKAVEVGHEQATKAGEAIKLLSESIERASTATQVIEISSQQQLVGMKQTVEAMQSVKIASEQNLTGAGQLEKAGRELQELGQRLQKLTQ